MTFWVITYECEITEIFGEELFWEVGVEMLERDTF